eukprot:superscaffoldBa00008813_g23642
MICRILLFISLTSCVCATCIVDVTKTSYQAEENNDITLEWMFSTKPTSSSTSLNILCKQQLYYSLSVLDSTLPSDFFLTLMREDE